MLDTLGLPLAFIFLALTILWFVIGSKGKWYLKTLFLVGAFFAFNLVWSATGDFLGWATYEELPKKFQVHWMIVENPSQYSKGSVYVLVSDMVVGEPSKSFAAFYNGRSKHDPRLYRMPYSEELHKQADKIIEHLKKGGTFVASTENANGQVGSGGKGKSKEKGNGNGGGGHSSRQEGMIYQLPPPSSLRK